jgi:hypothetical protein
MYTLRSWLKIRWWEKRWIKVRRQRRELLVFIRTRLKVNVTFSRKRKMANVSLCPLAKLKNRQHSITCRGLQDKR